MKSYHRIYTDFYVLFCDVLFVIYDLLFARHINSGCTQT